MSIATGGSGGVYQVYGGGVAQMLSANGHPTNRRDDQRLRRQSLPSWPTATRRSPSGWPTRRSMPSRARTSFNGEQLPLRALGTLYSNFTHVVALESSGIKKIEDLKGKKVSIGAPNSVGYRGDRAAVDGGRGPRSREGREEALARRGRVGSGAARGLARRVRCGPAACPRARSPTSRPPTTSSCCRWTWTCLSSTSAMARRTWKPRLKRTNTLAFPRWGRSASRNLLMVREDMDPTLAHSDRIKLMFDHRPELAEVHPSAEKLTVEDAQKVVEPVQLHEGAEQYYAETAKTRAARSHSVTCRLVPAASPPSRRWRWPAVAAARPSSRSTVRAARWPGGAAGRRALRAHVPALRLQGGGRGALQGHRRRLRARRHRLPATGACSTTTSSTATAPARATRGSCIRTSPRSSARCRSRPPGAASERS